MKINCSVEVLNRALPSLNMASKKAKKSILTLGKFNDEHFIFHQSTENMCGKKYKVNNNIKNVFVKFLNEGKATIRFEEPNHDLAINCDPIQLKGFLRTLKLCLAGVQSAQLSSIHSINTSSKSMKPVKTKLKITQQEDYPVLEGFPRTLQVLIINHANVKRFDSRILRLRNLAVLNLENNSLTTLPEGLGASLTNLAELYLGNNSLGESRDWKWIVNKNLSKRLKLLDLSSNKIESLPDKLVKLENLVTLKLNDNNLKTLPKGIGNLKMLRHVSLSNNKIAYLPGSFLSLQLNFVDISTNSACNEECRKLINDNFHQVPTLLDLAATCVIMKRLQYSEETVPQTIIDYLEDAPFCVCGNPSFYSKLEGYIPYQRFVKCPSAVVFSRNVTVPVSVRFCTFRCYSKCGGQGI